MPPLLNVINTVLKKTFYIIGFFILLSCALRGHSVLQAQERFSGKEADVPYSTARLFDGLGEKIGINLEADWTQSFGTTDEKKVGQNLYLTILNQTKNQPVKKARRGIAGKYGLSEGDIVLLEQGNIEPIIKRKPTLRQEQAYSKMYEIQQKLLEERELNELKADIDAEVSMNEIFANGDLGDSGFDLVNDLTLIENLLFLQSSPIDIGDAYGPSGTGESSGGNNGSDNNGNNTPPDNSGNGSSGSNGGNGNTPGTDGNEPDDGSDDDSDQVDPASCFADPSLASALDDATGSSNDGSGTNGPTNAPNALPDGGTALPVDTQQLLASSDDVLPEIPTPNAPPVQPAPADEWKLPQGCNDVYCLTVNYVTKPAQSLYADPDNCIACHVEKINERLKKTVSHTLAPNKATGNFGEIPKCKSSLLANFSSVNMNVYAIRQPIKTPLNDDLMLGTNLSDDFKTFCNSVAFFPFSACDDAKKGTFDDQQNLIDVQTKLALTQAPDAVPFSTINQNIASGLQIAQAETSRLTATQSTGDEINAKMKSYRPLAVEMDQMNIYFMNLRDTLKSLHEPVDAITGPQACTILKNKKQCE